jgi:hypothetical protein
VARKDHPVTDRSPADIEFDRLSARLIRREALRREAANLNTASPGGLENVLAQISAETTADAAERRASTSRPITKGKTS